MEKYIKPAIEIVNLNVESALLAASDPNALGNFDGYSTPGADDDGDGLVDGM